MAAILYRARELGLMTPTAFENAMKYLSRKGWRVREPGRAREPEQPALLAEALSLLEQSGVSVDALAEEANLPGSEELAARLRVEPRERLAVAL